MDMVVSVCTSVIHMAGALDIPSMVLLSPHADWRWLEEVGPSTWYPKTTIYRQNKSGDWNELITRVSSDLAKQFS